MHASRIVGYLAVVRVGLNDPGIGTGTAYRDKPET